MLVIDDIDTTTFLQSPVLNGVSMSQVRNTFTTPVRDDNHNARRYFLLINNTHIFDKIPIPCT